MADDGRRSGAADVPGMLLTSRAFEEYVAFLDLDPAGLPDRILDACAGASNFVATATRLGCRAVAIDPAYADPEATVRAAGAGIAGGGAVIADHRDRFTYDWYGGAAGRDRLRADALSDFLADFRADAGRRSARYVAAALPDLPFAARAFDLAVCSHLLFTWATHLSRDWHLAALRELTRVAREVRVFPLVLQGTGEPVAWLPDLRAELRGLGVASAVREVGYEFQVGGRHALFLTRDAGPVTARRPAGVPND